jgi:hypothetical protein
LARLKNSGPVEDSFNLDAVERFNAQQSTRHGG